MFPKLWFSSCILLLYLLIHILLNTCSFFKKSQIFFLPSDTCASSFLALLGLCTWRSLLLVCFPHLLQTSSALAMLCQLGPSLHSYRTVHAAYGRGKVPVFSKGFCAVVTLFVLFLLYSVCWVFILWITFMIFKCELAFRINATWL